MHSHTWYANLGGHLAKLVHGIPHVATVHSLEPLRPWKAEQLGGGYALSSFCERTGLEGADAIIAVSAAMRGDILAPTRRSTPARVTVIHNGIDTDEFRPDHGTDAPRRASASTRRVPSVVFVGRITRQKGLPHLLDAARELDPRRAARALRRRARHARARRRDRGARSSALRAAGRPRRLDRGDAPAARADPAR